MGESQKHIILGAGGAIGQPLALELLSRKENVRLVSRRPKPEPGAETLAADLLNAEQVLDAIEPSSTVYLVAGLQYRTRVWQAEWPKLIENVLAACRRKRSRLIFFDNVYMYGKVLGPMTEETPMRPVSKKGEIRAQIAGTLLREMEQNTIPIIIARSADFYGPFAKQSSTPYVLAVEPLRKGKRPRWLGNAKVKHSLTYTLDCAKALVLLASAEDAWNQVWHLPTASPPITGEEFITIAARELGVEPRYTVLRKWMLSLGGLFDPLVRELPEMLYQNDRDYVFDSSKFNRRFNFTPTPYEEGIKETMRA